jgi:hypothetical protein
VPEAGDFMELTHITGSPKLKCNPFMKVKEEKYEPSKTQFDPRLGTMSVCCDDRRMTDPSETADYTRSWVKPFSNVPQVYKTNYTLRYSN